MFFICVSSIIFVSCNKEQSSLGKTILNGTALDITTGDSFANLEIELFENSNSPLFFSTKIDSVITNSGGNFSLTFIDKKNYHYTLFAKGLGIINGAKSQKLISNLGVESNLILEVYPISHIKFCVKNVFKEYSTFYYSAITSLEGGKTLNGLDIDTCIVLMAYGNTLNYFSYNYNSRFDSLIFCPANDTIFFSVEY